LQRTAEKLFCLEDQNLAFGVWSAGGECLALETWIQMGLHEETKLGQWFWSHT